MRIVDVKQGSELWHEFRRTSLGATSASVICGCNPWKSVHDLYEEMVEGKITPLNDAMKRGMELEEWARIWAEERLQMSLFPVTARHEFLDYMHASFDGLSIDGEVLIEIKCPGEKTHHIACQGKIPDYYKWQMQHQMEVANVDHMFYISYRSPDDVVMIQYNRDDVMIEDLLLKQKKFYFEHIVPKIPPINTKKLVELDLSAAEVKLMNLKNLEELDKKIKHLQDLRKYVYDSILEDMEESFCVDKYKCTRYFVKGAIDYTSIKEIEGIDLEQYRKEGRWQWKIS